ncbi:Wzz/FepE/Etk N-terminal domain-containing protein [Micromonospora sp. CPCC 206061]|uniref:Wzz/FepE/Etk N-terminal domain-containing protein n=1 Tax=Micromonospora sp. CPCC 206061 TaxID=3122410 RepID=UPI002FF365F3
MHTALYVRVLRANWLLIALFALLGGVVLGVLACQKEPVYRSEASLLVEYTPEVADASKETRLLMQRRVKTYNRMVTSTRITEPVVKSLRLPYSPAELAERVTASSPVDTYAINITVTASTPRGATDIADAIAAELAKVAAREKSVPALPVSTEVTVTKAPSVPDAPEPSLWWLKAGAGALAGAAFGLVLGILRQGMFPA